MVDSHQLLTSLGFETGSTEMGLDTVRLGILGTEVPVVLADQVALEVLVFLEVQRLLCLAVLVVQVDRDDLVDRKVPAVQAVQADHSLLVVLLALDNRLVLEVLVGQVVLVQAGLEVAVNHLQLLALVLLASALLDRKP